MLKDLLYTGLGGALLARERVEKELEKLREKGKLSKEELEKVLDKAKARGEEEEAKAKEELKSVLKEVIDELGVATKADIEALKDSLKK
ncbi:MAG: hypothetical protein GXO33_08675 [Epsilonproteobacteria bacterium]|nr:hypothetical protein [Campylobacterota bacterium]